MEKKDAGMTSPSGQQAVTSVAEAMYLVREIAGPKEGAEGVKALMNRAARRLGWAARRIKQAWYGEAAAWRADEMDAMRLVARDELLRRLDREEAKLASLRARAEALRGRAAA